ncbi:MAG: hypothetical protein LUH59_02275 [Firmicutes bacterium]|nr:hypothetical protein [Bacillota bacterium]
MAIETEFKFLIKMPSKKLLSGLDESDIEQLYLPPTGGYHSERVRARRRGDTVVYTHTRKRSISRISAIEDEEIISEAQYLRYKAASTSGLTKKRYVMQSGGFYYEIDVYPFWSRTAVLEVEFDEDGEIPEVPECFSVVRDVTDVPEYKNYALSLKIPPEE